LQKYRKILLFVIIAGGPSVYFTLIWPNLALTEAGLNNAAVYVILRIILSIAAVKKAPVLNRGFRFLDQCLMYMYNSIPVERTAAKGAIR
jgi:hypothetical protein